MATERAEALRPEPEQGNLTAAAVVALTVLVATVNARFGGEWGVGIHLVYTGAAALAVIGMAAMSPRPFAGDRPATWQSVLFVASFVLLFGTLANLADVLGADDAPFGASGTIVWVGLILVALTIWFARGWNSGISNLLGALTLLGVILAFVDWVFTPEEVDTFRWILLFAAVGFGAYGVATSDREPDHAVGDVNTAGVALLALAGTFIVETIVAGIFGAFGGVGSSGPDVGWGWELVLLVGAALLIAYAVTAWRAGPGYLGAANLLAFVVLAAGPGDDGPSLIGWPLVLILVTIGLFALARGGGRPGAGVPVGPGPEPSESPTAVQPRP
jgi:hypothetical protein